MWWSESGGRIGRERSGKRGEERERERREGSVGDYCSGVRVETMPSPVFGPHCAAVW